MAPATLDPLLGRVLGGKVEVQARLGSGGMGKVYRGFHHGLRLPVAVKVLGEGPNQGELIRRLRVEVQATQSIDHPNVVRIHELGVEVTDNLVYVVMEYVEGRPVSSLVAGNGTLPVPRACGILRDVARALAAAHAAQVLHRDVKPDNVMLTRVSSPGGFVDHVKLVDFGLAKRTHAGATKLTETGMMMGTPGYMPMEQLLGEAVDARTDVYSCGVMLYRLLSGRDPYPARDLGSLLRQMQQPAAPLTDVPPALDAVVRRAMAPRPEDRFGSAEALAWALEAFAQPAGAMPPAPAAMPPRNAPLPEPLTEPGAGGPGAAAAPRLELPPGLGSEAPAHTRAIRQNTPQAQAAGAGPIPHPPGATTPSRPRAAPRLDDPGIGQPAAPRLDGAGSPGAGQPMADALPGARSAGTPAPGPGGAGWHPAVIAPGAAALPPAAEEPGAFAPTVLSQRARVPSAGQRAAGGRLPPWWRKAAALGGVLLLALVAIVSLRAGRRDVPAFVAEQLLLGRTEDAVDAVLADFDRAREDPRVAALLPSLLQAARQGEEARFDGAFTLEPGVFEGELRTVRGEVPFRLELTQVEPGFLEGVLSAGRGLTWPRPEEVRVRGLHQGNQLVFGEAKAVPDDHPLAPAAGAATAFVVRGSSEGGVELVGRAGLRRAPLSAQRQTPGATPAATREPPPPAPKPEPPPPEPERPAPPPVARPEPEPVREDPPTREQPLELPPEPPLELPEPPPLP